MRSFKFYAFLFTLLIGFSQCQQSEDPNAIPTDLTGLKSIQKETKQSIRDLEKKLEQIETEIEKLDPNSREKVSLVTTLSISKKDFKHYVNIQSTVQSDEVVKIGSETGGRIVKLYVDEGDYVRKGKLIAKIDMESVNKQLAEIETSASLARDVFNRQKKLWDQGIGSEMQYLQAKNNVDRLEKTKETLSYQLTKGQVYSPISGVIDMIMAESGEVTMPGVPMVQILNTSKLKVVADLPENYLTSVKSRDMVKINFPALDKEIEGRISLIGRSIDPANRTFKVEVNVANKGGMLKPNLLAEMHINDFTVKDALTVPIRLVQEEVGGKNFVFVVDKSEEHQRAKKTYIITQESGEDEIVVTEGLSPTDILVDAGSIGLTDGSLITINTANNE